VIKVNAKILHIGVLMLVVGLITASAQQTPPELNELWDLHAGIATIASALGALIIAHAGLRWIMAQSPEERDEAKKTIIYVIIGLMFVVMTKDIVDGVYCWTLTTAGTGSC